MRYLILFHFCVTIFQLFPSILSFDPAIVRTIDTVIESLVLPYNNLRGFGLAIVKDNNGVPDFLNKGYGFKDFENQLGTDNQTLFAIGSITKSFTATVIVKILAEKFPELGESVMDVPIRTLSPSTNFTLSDRFRSESTSFRDLLSHRLCVYPETLGLVLRSYRNKEEFVYRQRYAEEVCSFRTNYVYSNAAFLVAGEIIAEIANSTFEDLLMDLMREIGMDSSIIVRDSDDYDNMPNMSKGYYIDKDGQTKLFNSEILKWISISSAPGGILSSSNDMAKYMLFHINNGKVGDKQVVPEKVIKYLRTSSTPFPSPSIGKTNPNDIINGPTSYGLGLRIGLLDGWEAIDHTGSLPPYSSYLSFYPALKLGIYTVTNGPNKYDTSTLHQAFYEVIERGQRDYDSIKNLLKSKDQPSSIKSDVKNAYDVQSVIKNEEIVGLYGNGLDAEFVISQVNGSGDGLLYITYGLLGTGTLHPLSNTSFSIEWDSGVDQLFTFLRFNAQIIDFKEENKALFTMDSNSEDEPFVFEKDLTLDKLPVQPWPSDSCGPTRKVPKGMINRRWD